MRCGHCGAPTYDLVNGRCRFCGTPVPPDPTPSPVEAQARGGGADAQATSTPPRLVRQTRRRPSPLSFSGSAAYVWEMTTGFDDWKLWVPAAVVAVLAIAVVWYMVLCWKIVA